MSPEEKAPERDILNMNLPEKAGLPRFSGKKMPSGRFFAHFRGV